MSASSPEAGPVLPARAEVLAQVRSLLAELLNLESEDSIQAGSRLVDDLQVDSLGMVDMVTLVEESFELKLASNTDLTAIQTVDHIVDLVLEHLAKKAA